MTMTTTALALILSCLATGPATTRARTAEDASTLANRLLAEGAGYFNAKDAAALVATYAGDAELVVMTRGEDGFESRRYEGHEQIRRLYNSLFGGAGSIRSTNVVEYARLVGPDLLLIAGTFEPDLGSGLLMQFVQFRIRQADGTWLIESLRLVPIPRS